MKKIFLFLYSLFIIGCNHNNASKETLSIQIDSITSSLEEKEQTQEEYIYLYEKYLLTSGKTLKTTTLPFSMKDYIDSTEDRDVKYSFYKPSGFLVNYFISIDYEGEEYKCYILPCKGKNLVLLTWIHRGDSEYYLLTLSNSEKVIDCKEIGKGGDDIVLFTIKENLEINTCIENNERLKSFQIQADKIMEIEK